MAFQAIIDERLIFKLPPLKTASKIVIGIREKYEKKQKRKKSTIRAKDR